MEESGLSIKKGIIRVEAVSKTLVWTIGGVFVHKAWTSSITRRPQYFVTTKGVQGPIITTFVDDLNIFATSGSGIMQLVKKELAAAFDMVDMGPLAFYVGLKVTRDRIQKTIKLSQPGYIENMLDRHGLLKAKTAKIPCEKFFCYLTRKTFLHLKKPSMLVRLDLLCMPWQRHALILHLQSQW